MIDVVLVIPFHIDHLRRLLLLVVFLLRLKTERAFASRDKPRFPLLLTVAQKTRSPFFLPYLFRIDLRAFAAPPLSGMIPPYFSFAPFL